MLTVTITHLKEGYIRRNGMPRSDKATVTEHWIRHGDFLTIATIVNDPVYLTEPFIRTTDYQLDLHQHVPPYPCEMVQEVERPKGVVPHHLFGTNKDLKEFCRALRTAVRSDARRRRDELSGLSEEAEAVDGTDADREVPGRSELMATRLRWSFARRLSRPPSAAGQDGRPSRPVTARTSAHSHPEGSRQRLDDAGRRAATSPCSRFPKASRSLTPARRRWPTRCWRRSGRCRRSRFATSSTPASIADHVGGNEKLAGIGLADHGRQRRGQVGTDGAEIIAHENVLERMIARTVQPPVPHPRDAADDVSHRSAEAEHRLSRRRHPGVPHAGGAHRRRQRRVLPSQRRARDRRRLRRRPATR